jgi:hypothetical protein
MTLKVQDGKNLEYKGAGGMVETSVGGAVASTGSAGGLAGGSGWSGEGVVVGGAGGATGEPSGSAGSTGCNCTGCIGEGVGVEELSFVREEVEALPL